MRRAGMVALYALFLALWVLAVQATLNVDSQTGKPVEITEDMPGWDCVTMGNGVCG